MRTGNCYAGVVENAPGRNVLISRDQYMSKVYGLRATGLGQVPAPQTGAIFVAGEKLYV